MGFFYAIGYAVGAMKRDYHEGREHGINATAIRAAQRQQDEFKRRVSELALTDRIAAIKMYRKHNNSSLAEAVAFVKDCRGEPHNIIL